MPDLDINGLPLATAVNAGDYFIKWDSTQVSGQRTQKITAAQFRAYIINIIPVGPAGPPGPTGAQGPQGLPGKDGGGAGTVTSVALSLPSDFGLSGSPITTSGTLTVTRNAQAANVVMAGPASGANAVPTYRALVAADIPALNYTTTAQAAAAAPVQSVAGRTGNVTLAVADVSGAAKSGANTDITSLLSPALGAATATTQAATDSSTKVATTAQVQSAIAASPSGSGAPSTINMPTLPYSATAADKGKVIMPVGTGALNLPSATAVSGWYAYIKKRDEGGAATLTPATGAIDGIASIIAYKEEFVVYYDAAASTAAGSPVYRTQGRQRGWIDFGTFTVAAGASAISVSAGAGDSEIRDLEIVWPNITPSTTASINVTVNQAGAAGTPSGDYIGGSSSTFVGNQISAMPLVPVAGSANPNAGSLILRSIQNTAANMISIAMEGVSAALYRKTMAMLTSSGAFSSVSFVPSAGTFAMTYNVRLYRP